MDAGRCIVRIAHAVGAFIVVLALLLGGAWLVNWVDEQYGDGVIPPAPLPPRVRVPLPTGVFTDVKRCDGDAPSPSCFMTQRDRTALHMRVTDLREAALDRVVDASAVRAHRQWQARHPFPALAVLTRARVTVAGEDLAAAALLAIDDLALLREEGRLEAIPLLSERP